MSDMDFHRSRGRTRETGRSRSRRASSWPRERSRSASCYRTAVGDVRRRRDELLLGNVCVQHKVSLYLANVIFETVHGIADPEERKLSYFIHILMSDGPVKTSGTVGWRHVWNHSPMHWYLGKGPAFSCRGTERVPPENTAAMRRWVRDIQHLDENLEVGFEGPVIPPNWTAEQLGKYIAQVLVGITHLMMELSTGKELSGTQMRRTIVWRHAWSNVTAVANGYRKPPS